MHRPVAERGVDVAGSTDDQPIVFVHGVMFTRAMWAPQRNALADEYRVVAPDLPGHGARADGTFDLDRSVALLDEVVESVAGGRATVVGLSLGGYVSAAFAHRHPEKVDSLVVAGSSVNPTGVLGVLTLLVSIVSWLATRSSRVNQAFRRRLVKWTRKRDLPPEVEREILEAGFYPTQFGTAGFELAFTDFRSAFGSFDGPALVLNGQRDGLNRFGEKKYAAAAPDARVETIEGAGHVCNLERPGAFNDTVRRFVASET